MTLRTVLIDDNDTVRETVAVMLTHAGHDVVGEADNGARGIEVALEERPDLVITDWRMPEMDGVEVTRRIRAADPGIVIIGFCATDHASVHGRFLQSGAWASFDKRDAGRLLDAIRALGGQSGVSRTCESGL